MNEPLRIEQEPGRNFITIEGIHYSHELFRSLGFGPLMQPLWLIKREDGVLTITTSQDCVEIADSCCRSDIECNFAKGDDGWYDTSIDAEENANWLPQCLRYLEARGLIERAATWPHVVRFKKVPA